MEKTSVVQRKRNTFRRRATRRVLPFVAALFMATPLALPVKKSMASAQRIELRAAQGTDLLQQRLHQQYSTLGLEAQGLRYETFARAMTGYLNLQAEGQLGEQKERLTIIDFDLPSTEKRLWVLDLSANKVLFHTLVAHGHNSGENEATNFSNVNQSNMSSLGFYVTSSEYEGKHGHSLHLKGVDEGFNTNALTRSIVMHGADYVSEDFIRQYGRLGRSLGCPALPMDQYSQIIDAVTGGTCLFLNRSDAGYSSRYLNENQALTALQGSATSPIS